MSLLNALLGRETRASAESPQVPLTAQSLIDLFAGKSTAGPWVSESNAHRIIAVYRAWALLGGTIGRLPVRSFTGDPPGGEAWTGPQSSLLQYPGGRDEVTGVPLPGAVTASVFYETLAVHLLSWGNAYVVKGWNAGRTRVAYLDLLMPSLVQPRWTKRTAANPAGKEFLIYHADGSPQVATPNDIIHIRAMGTSLLQGISPVGAARQGLGLTVAAEEYGARFFANGSLATGILEAPFSMKREQAEALKGQWTEKASGLSNAHEALVLDAGVKFHQLTIPPEDAQFLQTRGFQVIEVARLYGIPPHLLGQVEKSTSWGTGIAEQGIGFNTYTLQPWLTRIQQALSNELLPRGVNCRFDVTDLLRGDPKAEVEAHSLAVQSGQETPNEARVARGLPPVPGGDQLLFPLNYGSLTNVIDPPVREPAAPALPAGAPADSPAAPAPGGSA